MTTLVSDLLVRFFREPSCSEYRKDINIKSLRLEYNDREREAMLSLLSGVLKDNPSLQEFELVATNSYIFLNVNNFVENFEDYYIGPALKKLTLRDAFRFTDKTRFLEEGSANLEELTINKTILNQKYFKLSD